MYRIGICDDGVNLCSFFEKVITEYAKREKLDIEVESWYCGEELKAYLETDNSLDILFLDIELLAISGIDVGRYIRNKLENYSLQIIYISGNSSYAQSLFQVQPMDFLIKPVGKERIEQALSLAIKIIGCRDERFEFQIGREYNYIFYRDIMYFYSEGRYIKVVKVKNDEDCEIEFYGKLKDIVKRLPMNFIQIHQSYIVNTTYIMQYKYEQVKLVDGKILPISKAYRKQIRSQVLNEE